MVLYVTILQYIIYCTICYLYIFCVKLCSIIYYACRTVKAAMYIVYDVNQLIVYVCCSCCLA